MRGCNVCAELEPELVRLAIAHWHVARAHKLKEARAIKMELESVQEVYNEHVEEAHPRVRSAGSG